jgi:charged multivesicular body protein 5
MNVLRKRKQYDTQLKNYMNQQFTLDQVAFTSESIQNTIEMANTMKGVIEQQKIVMVDLDMDKLDDLRDEMDELKYESDYMN